MTFAAAHHQLIPSRLQLYLLYTSNIQYVSLLKSSKWKLVNGGPGAGRRNREIAAQSNWRRGHYRDGRRQGSSFQGYQNPEQESWQTVWSNPCLNLWRVSIVLTVKAWKWKKYTHKYIRPSVAWDIIQAVFLTIK